MDKKQSRAHVRVVLAAIIAIASIVMAFYFVPAWAAKMYGLFFGYSPSSVLWYWQTLTPNPGFKTAITVTAAFLLILNIYWVAYLWDDKVALHGEARFASEKELAAAGLFAPKGVIVGQTKEGKYLVYDGQTHIMVAAPTGSGKGVGLVLPNLLNWRQSVFVNDIKLENWRITSGWRQKVLKQDVFLFAPFEDGQRSNRWNPLDGVSRQPDRMAAELLQMAGIFYPSRAGDKNRFFYDMAQLLFTGLALYLIETKQPVITLGEIYRQGSGMGKPVNVHIQELLEKNNEKLSSTCKTYLSDFLAAPGETFSNIKSTFSAALMIFAIPNVDWATSASDFDFNDVRRKPTSIYIGVQPDKLELAQRIFNLFITQLINTNTNVLPEDDKTLTQQLLLINDEFTAPGALEVIKKSIAYIRGYNLRLMTIIQAPSQLRDPAFYGKEGAETIIQNHALKVIYPPSDDSIAEEYSKLLGHYTLRERNSSANRSGKGIGEINQNVSYGESYSNQKRPLMYPQELKLLGKDQQIVAVSGEGVYPALTQKAFYYKSPIFLGRLAQSSAEFKRFLAKITQPSKSELDGFRVRGEFEAVIHHKQHVNLQPLELLNTITNEPPNVLAIDEGRLMSALEESIPDVGDMPSIDAWLAAVELEMSSAIKSSIKSPSEATS